METIEKIRNKLNTRHVSPAMLSVLVGQLKRDGYKKTEKYYTKRYKEVQKENNSKDIRGEAFREMLTLIDTLQQYEGKL